MKGKIAEMVQAYVDATMSTVMAEHGLIEPEFRKSKCPMAVRARTIVIRRLKADGLGTTAISQFTGMRKGLIERRMYPEQRARGNELRKLAYRAQKQAMEARA